MANMGDKFRAVAQKIILKFSEELGKSTLKSKVEAEESEAPDYNPSTGLVTQVYADVSLYMASDAISMLLANIGTSSGGFEPQYLREHRVIYISGLDLDELLASPPKTDDLIIFAGETQPRRIDQVDTDQYKALYTCYVEKGG